MPSREWYHKEALKDMEWIEAFVSDERYGDDAERDDYVEEAIEQFNDIFLWRNHSGIDHGLWYSFGLSLDVYVTGRIDEKLDTVQTATIMHPDGKGAYDFLPMSAEQQSRLISFAGCVVRSPGDMFEDQEAK